MKGRKGAMDMSGAIVGVLALAVTVVIGVVIVNEFISANYTQMGFNSDGTNDNTSTPELEGSWNQTVSMSVTGMTLLPVTIIVIAALAVISAVLYMQRA